MLRGGRAATSLRAGRAYRCFCTPEELEARAAGRDGGRPPAEVQRPVPGDRSRRWPSTRVGAGEAGALRFAVPDGRDVTFHDIVRGEVTFNTDVIGDPVIVRSDGRPAYNFAVVVDDAAMEITHVVRGEDHISNTPRQILLYEALGLPAPVFAHLSLVLGPDHAPLSKRHGATSVAEFRERGYLPEALVNYLALLGWSPGENEELVPRARRWRAGSIWRACQPQRRGVRHRQARLDEPSLHEGSADPIAWREMALPYFVRAGCVDRVLRRPLAFVELLLPMVVGSVDRLEEIPERVTVVVRLGRGASGGDDLPPNRIRPPRGRSFARSREEIAHGPALDRRGVSCRRRTRAASRPA